MLWKQQPQQQQQSGIAEIIQESLRKSSIRGLPRILGAKSRLMRGFWTATVLILFACLAQNIHNLVDSYRRADTIINTKQWTSQDRQFPTVTICNLNPFSASNRLVKQRGSLTPSEYRDRVIHMTKEANRRGLIDKEEMDLYQDELLNLKAYYDNIDVYLKKYMESYPLILSKSCKIYYRKGNVRKSRKCDSIERSYVFDYTNCYSVNVYSTKDELVEKVVISTLTHSEDEGVKCSRCIVDNPQSLRQGVIMHLHPHNQYPLYIKEGLYIAPGTQNIIQVKQRKYNLIKDCSTDHPTWVHFYVNDAQKSSHYTRELCSTIAKHAAVKRACNCSIEAFPHLSARKNQYDSCYQQNLSAPVINTKLLDCVADIEGRHHQTCGSTAATEADTIAGKNCARPCNTEDFSVAHTSTLGATKGSALDIYRHYIRGVVNIPSK
uniref:Acid-sensing ion channel 1 n=1 Tax=Macrostomum lignano TaxID=282301 RepID=A0A1I8IJ41_9PLAT